MIGGILLSFVLFHRYAQARTTLPFIGLPRAVLHTAHVFQQGQFSRREIFFGLVAQSACFSFFHYTQSLGDLFRPCKPLQLSEGFQEGGSRLEKCFHHLFFSSAVLNAIAYEGHNGGAWLIKRRTSYSKYTLFFITMQYLSKRTEILI